MNRLSATCLLLLLVVEASSGQRPRVSPKRLAVDVVSVQRGPQLYGAVLAGNATEGLTMAVERSWLEKTWPRYYRDLAAGELALATAASEGLQGRVEKWRRSRSGDANLVLFLQQEASRLRGAKGGEDEAPASQFVLIELAADEVRNLYRQPPPQRRVAEVAWALRIANVTTRTVNSLRREIEKREYVLLLS